MTRGEMIFTAFVFFMLLCFLASAIEKKLDKIIKLLARGIKD